MAYIDRTGAYRNDMVVTDAPIGKSPKYSYGTQTFFMTGKELMKYLNLSNKERKEPKYKRLSTKTKQKENHLNDDE